jgi:hypothetical protein
MELLEGNNYFRLTDNLTLLFLSNTRCNMQPFIYDYSVYMDFK